MNVVNARNPEDERLYAEKVGKFEKAHKSFDTLVESLMEYKAAISNLTDCGVTVAKNLEKFFSDHDKSNKQVADQYLKAQQSIHSKWVNESEKSFDKDILIPIKTRLDEIPEVRIYMKDRSNALADMQKRQKKLQSDRKKEGNKFREKQRKCKDVSDKYSMLHDEVLKRFNYIDRNMGTFVTAPLRSLITIMSNVSKSTFESLENVVKMIVDNPPFTKDLATAPPMNIKDVNGGIVDTEKWDDLFEDDDDDNENENENENDDDNDNINDNVDENDNSNFNNNHNTPQQHKNQNNHIDFDNQLSSLQINHIGSSAIAVSTDNESSPYSQQDSINASFIDGINPLTNRIKSADVGPSSNFGTDSPHLGELPFQKTCRRGRSVSSAPTESSSNYGAYSLLPYISSQTTPSKSQPINTHPSPSLISHHHTPQQRLSPASHTHSHSRSHSQPMHHQQSNALLTPTAPGSSSEHASQLGDQSAVFATSAASSVSTDNMVTDRLPTQTNVNQLSSLPTSGKSKHTRSRKGSADTVGSLGSASSSTSTRLIAIYNFAPRQENELALEVGNVVEVISKHDAGWWCGQSGRSRGYFPQNYTRPLSEKEELEYLAVRERRRKRRGHRSHQSSDSRQSSQSPIHPHSSVSAV